MHATASTTPLTDISNTVVFTDLKDSTQAGYFIGHEIKNHLKAAPDAVIIFASSRHDYRSLLAAVKESCQPKIIVGCSSAGEFVNGTHGEGAISAVAFHSKNIRFSASIGHGLKDNPKQAAQEAAASFTPMHDVTYPYRSALILADALAGHTDELIEQLYNITAGTYQFFGGGAGDDAKFSETHVFLGTEVYTNAVVALEILSTAPVGIGVRHGWEQSSNKMRVTESENARLISLNAAPAIEAFREHAQKTGQEFNENDPVAFFLHNVIGIQTATGYKLRVPLSINSDGSINCASDIPAGTIVSIMKTTSESASKAAHEATEDALRQVGDNEPGVALLFDCVATRLRTGQEFEYELDAVAKDLNQTSLIGCNTYGQIARVDGQFNGFHNCTAVVCVIPN